jgi:PAS domain S-box-containing protein
MEGQLAAFRPADSFEDAVLESIRDIYRKIGSHFDRLVQTEKGDRFISGNVDLAIHDHLAERLYLFYRAIDADIGRIFTKRYQRMRREQMEASVLAIVLTLSLSGMMFTLSIIARRNVLNPIRKLQAGMDRVGKGDLEYRVPVRQQDEIGDVTATFNTMVKRLSDVTTSRDDLAREIEARQRAERELEQERAQLVALFESIDDIIYVADPETHELVYVNPAFKRNWGEDVLGKTCYKVLQDLDAPCPFCTNDKIFGEHEGETYEWEFQNKVTGHWYRCADKAIRWPDGRMVRFELASDITESKTARERLRRASEDLQRSNRDLEQFAYVASHDLQEPLRMVASYTQLLERRYREQLDDDAREFIDYAVDGANRMQTLINDLLQYSRVGTRGNPFEPTDMNEVMADIRVRLGVAIEESGAMLTHDELPTVPADRQQIAQVFQNLVANAIKFKGQEQPRIHVSADKEKTNWRFSVTDNGIGIEPEYKDRIFIIFQRLHSRREYAGTGIGLAVCKKIVERHGGQIRVESQPGKGCVFSFTLPFRQKQDDERDIPVDQESGEETTSKGAYS